MNTGSLICLTELLPSPNNRGFKSRSFQSFQEALERGEASHMMPVENAKERLRKKEIKLEDIPYMQRGGSWVRSHRDENTFDGVSFIYLTERNFGT